MARKVLAEFDAIDGPFLNKMRAIDRSIGRFETGTLNAFGRVEKGISGLLTSASQLRNVTGLVAGGLGASLATEFLDTATRIHNALKSINADSKEAFEGLYLAATRSLTSMDGMAQGVMRMHKVMGDTQPLSKSIRQIETLNKLLALGGKSTTERESTLLQFTQALQAGALQGDEMRALRENAPVEFLRAIAREAGGTIADLKKFSAEAKITTDVMIRALNSLEQEADTRIKNVTMTIADGANALRNGAIVAAEGFDKGLGLSRAAVATLTTVGEILGTNAEAAEWFGKAVQVAGLAFAASFGGRSIISSLAALKAIGPEASAAASTALAAAKAANDADAQALVTRAQKVNAIQRQITGLQNEGASVTRLKTAYASLERAQAMSASALLQYKASSDAVAAAQMRLTFASRASAAAGAMVRSAWSFLGGWPGILMITGIAFMSMNTRAEEFAATMQKAGDAAGSISGLASQYDAVASEIEGDTKRLKTAHEEVAEAIRSQGVAANDAKTLEIAAIEARIAKNKELLTSIAAVMSANLQTSKDELGRARSSFANQFGGERGAKANFLDPSIQKNALAAYTAAVDEKIRTGQRLTSAEQEFVTQRLAIAQQEAAIAEQQVVVEQTLAASRLNGAAAAEHAARAEAQLTDSSAPSDEALAKFREKMAVLEQETELQRLINQYGENSVQVTEARAAAEREAYMAVAQTDGMTADMVDSLMKGYDAKVAMASVDIESGIAAAASTAAQLAKNLGVSLSIASRILAMGAGGKPEVILDPRDPRYNKTAATMANISANYGRVSPFDPSRVDTGKGGSGGGSSGTDPQEEALRFIEQMMTAEEKRAKQIKEMTDLRRQLVETYGPEAAIVAQLDEALQRAGESMSALDTVAKGFFDTLSDEIANSIEDWKGWGSLIRSILASLVRQHGVDFFTALLTPGKQSGGGLGTMLGNMLTGQNHSGGNEHGRVPRYISPAAFIGAPRFHNGLASDEFTAILQKGETVLPKGMSLGGNGVTINMPVDMRGVDESMKPYIDGRLKQIEKEFPARVLGAIQKHKQSRSL